MSRRARSTMGGLSEERQSGAATGATTREPRRFHVILHNDDYTTMEFVIEVLVSIFRKSAEEAAAVMLAVHERGKCSCGVYTEEMAETKVAQVRHKAGKAGFPLRCSMEEA